MNLFQVTKKQEIEGYELRTMTGDIVSFTPSYSEPLQEPFGNLNVKTALIPSLTGYTAVNLTACGVNLFDKTNVANGYIDDSNGQVSGGAYYKHTDYIPVISGEKVYIKTEQTSARWGAWYDENKNYISGISNYSQTEATAPNNACFIRLTCKTDDTGNLDTFAVNYPSTSTYHAYTGNTYTIAFGQTVYGGVLDVTSGKLHVTHGFVDLGSLSYEYDTTTLSVPVFYANITDRKLGDLYGLSDIYACLVGARALLESNNYAITRWNNSSGAIVIRNDDYTDKNTFKTAMSGHKLVYELATPFDIDLTPEVISAIVGENNVFADCGQTTVTCLI